MDYTKRVSETILVEADFSPLMDEDEAVESATVTALEHGAGSVVEDLDLETADTVSIELVAGSAAIYRRSWPAAEFTDARLVLYAGNEEAEGLIDPGSVSEEEEILTVIDLHENKATIRFVGGSAGADYRVRFTAVTSLGCTRVLDRTVAVIP